MLELFQAAKRVSESLLHQAPVLGDQTVIVDHGLWPAKKEHSEKHSAGQLLHSVSIFIMVSVDLK